MKIPLMPYFVGVPAQTAAFYGRRNSVVWLSSELQSASTHSLLLYGSEAIGKTSFLYHVQLILRDDGFLPVYFALGERPLNQLLNDLAQQILEQTGLDLPLPESSNAFRSHFLPDVQRHQVG